MDFYCCDGSAPCRSVEFVAKFLGVKLNRKLVDLDAGEHLAPEYIKLNPQHTVPTLVDNGFVIWESRSIIMYLVDKYAKNDVLYPKDPQKRALVNQRLIFDSEMCCVYTVYFYPQLFEKSPENAELLKKLHSCFDIVNNFLEGKTYIAGDHMTIADISFLTSLTMFEVAGVEIKNRSNITKWLGTMKKEFPYWEENHADNLRYKAWIDMTRSK